MSSTDPAEHLSLSSSPSSPPVATPGACEAESVEAADADGTRPRHAAITRNLNTWSSYKSWTEQMRDAWESPEGAPDATRTDEPLAEPPLAGRSLADPK